MEGIAAVAEENSASTEEVSASAEEVSATVQEMAARAEQLAVTSTQLQALVARFNLGTRDAPDMRPEFPEDAPLHRRAAA